MSTAIMMRDALAADARALVAVARPGERDRERDDRERDERVGQPRERGAPRRRRRAAARAATRTRRGPRCARDHQHAGSGEQRERAGTTGARSSSAAGSGHHAATAAGDCLAQPGVLDERARGLERGERLVGVGPVAGELHAVAALEERGEQRAVLGRSSSGARVATCRNSSVVSSGARIS